MLRPLRVVAGASVLSSRSVVVHQYLAAMAGVEDYSEQIAFIVL